MTYKFYGVSNRYPFGQNLNVNLKDSEGLPYTVEILLNRNGSVIKAHSPLYEGWLNDTLRGRQVTSYADNGKLNPVIEEFFSNI